MPLSGLFFSVLVVTKCGLQPYICSELRVPNFLQIVRGEILSIHTILDLNQTHYVKQHSAHFVF